MGLETWEYSGIERVGTEDSSPVDPEQLDLAEAGGKNPAKLTESLQAIPSIVEKML